MHTTEQIDTASVRELASAAGPCITIVLQHNGTGDSALQLKHAVETVRQELTTRGADQSLLDPVLSVAKNAAGAAKPHDSLVILRSPTILQVHRVSGATPLVRVDDHFDLRTVLAVAQSDIAFYLLALSMNRTRILKCDRATSEELPFPAGMPNSLADFKQTRKPDHVLDNRASGGPSIGGGTVMFGTSSDREDKDEYMVHFFSSLDRAVNVALKGAREPLVVVGVEHEIALYRRVNTYANLVEPGVHGAPDGLEGGEMHRRALELLDQRNAQPMIDLSEYDKKVGTGHASHHVQEIVAAAYEGRVSHLFFQESARYLGTYDPARQRVKHIDDGSDLIEAAAFETLRQGGEVKLSPASAMPNGVPVCAFFRYPAAVVSS